MTISIYFAVFVACALVLDRSGLAGLGLLCVLTHECGHILALKLLKVQADKIEFRLFGININLKNGVLLSYKQEILLALSGCAANFLMCIPVYIFYYLEIAKDFFATLFIFNLVLGCFNLLPIVSLDGGRALEAYLCMKIGCPKAENTMNILSVVFIIPVAGAGFYILMQTGYNISLIAVSIYLFSALVVKSGRKFA